MPGSGTELDPYICMKNETFQDGEYTRNYIVIGSVSITEAILALLADTSQAPVTHPDDSLLYRQVPSGDEDEDNPNHFDLSIDYKANNVAGAAVGDEELIPGASITHTVKQKQAFSVVAQYTASGVTAINTYGMIGATKDGVEGIDEEEPGFGFGIRKKLTKGALTIALMATVASYCKRVNSLTWRSWAAGEVYFKDYSFDNSDPDFDIAEFYFEISPNVSGLVLPSPFGDITITDKAGWDYLDIVYVDDPGGLPIKIPHTAQVVRTKKFIDLNGLI